MERNGEKQKKTLIIHALESGRPFFFTTCSSAGETSATMSALCVGANVPKRLST